MSSKLISILTLADVNELMCYHAGNAQNFVIDGTDI